MPCVLRLNGAEAAPSTVVYAGDSIEFVPAVSGAPAQRTLKDLLGADFTGGVTVNGRLVDLDTRLSTGDQVATSTRSVRLPVRPAAPPPRAEPVGENFPVERPREEPPRTAPPRPEQPRTVPPKVEAPKAEPASPELPAERPVAPPAPKPGPWEKTPETVPAAGQRALGMALQVMLNGKALLLPGKPEGAPYYVMDLLEHSGIDFEHLDRGVELQVNGTECAFTQELRPRDDVVIA